SPPPPPRPSGQTQQLWALAQQDRGKIAEIFGAENVEAVLRELEGEMAKMRALEKTAGRIDRCRAQGEGEKRGEDELAWRAWVEGHYLPRLKREKEGGGGERGRRRSV
ncbi:hypothetical protein Naga_101922g2, partial [Nannochloropsis gaditana]